jgi:hypothetical protein
MRVKVRIRGRRKMNAWCTIYTVNGCEVQHQILSGGETRARESWHSTAAAATTTTAAAAAAAAAAVSIERVACRSPTQQRSRLASCSGARCVVNANVRSAVTPQRRQCITTAAAATTDTVTAIAACALTRRRRSYVIGVERPTALPLIATVTATAAHVVVGDQPVLAKAKPCRSMAAAIA